MKVSHTLTAMAIIACSQPLDTGVQGVWLDATHRCTCTALLSTSECSASDCSEANALVLAADHTSQDEIIRFSDTNKTMSIVGGGAGILRGHWSIDTTTSPARLIQVFDATGKTYETPVSRSGDRLVRGVVVTYSHAPDHIQRAVEGGSATWLAVPYP
jgi:hypothetical protein